MIGRNFDSLHPIIESIGFHRHQAIIELGPGVQMLFIDCFTFFNFDNFPGLNNFIERHRIHFKQPVA